MATGIIASHIRRTNWTLFFVNAALVAGAASLGWGFFSAIGQVPGEEGAQSVMVGLCVLAVAVGVWNMGKLVRRVARAERHPILRALARYGAPAAVAAEIDREAQSGPDTRRLGSVLLTRSWVLRATRFGLDVLRLDEAVWIYPRVTRHYRELAPRWNPSFSPTPTSLPVGRTFAVVVERREGPSLVLPCRKRDLGPLFEGIVRRAPWAVAGYDERLQQQWWSDRATVVRAVDERRGQRGSEP